MKRLLSLLAVLALFATPAHAQGVTRSSAASSVSFTGVPDGSASAPSLAFATQPTFGWYKSASNVFALTNAAGTVPTLLVDAYGSAGVYQLRRANGSPGSLTNITANQSLGSFGWLGYGATGYSTARAIFIANADEAWSDTAQGTSFSFYRTRATTATAGRFLYANDNNSGEIDLFPSTDAAATHGGYLQLYNATASGGGVVQTNIRTVALVGTGPAGNFFSQTNYANPNLFFGVEDTSGNNANAYSLGSEFNWTNAGGFANGEGFYLFDQVLGKTALAVGYGGQNFNIGASGAGNGYTLFLWGKMAEVGGVATDSTNSQGIPFTLKRGRSTGTNAAVNPVATITPSVDTTVEVESEVEITAATSCSFNIQVSWTDPAGNSRTMTELVQQNGTTSLITTMTAVGVYTSAAVPIRVKGGTAISTLTSGTFTSCTYTAESILKQVS